MPIAAYPIEMSKVRASFGPLVEDSNIVFRKHHNGLAQECHLPSPDQLKRDLTSLVLRQVESFVICVPHRSEIASSGRSLVSTFTIALLQVLPAKGRRTTPAPL